MADTVKIISPVNGQVYAERKVATGAEIEAAVTRARAAQRQWRQAPLEDGPLPRRDFSMRFWR